MTEAPLPRENDLLVGQEAAERAMLDAWNGGRMAHSWLICGPRGIGKATLAYRFARFALSGGEGQAGGLFGDALPPADLAMAPDHPIFRRVASGGHADLKVVERRIDEKKDRLRSEIVVDDARGIGEFMSRTAAEGGWRVVIVDAADEMNPNAANSILKVLEEPPKRALLLLVAHSPGRLLPTIRSRCRRLTLRPLADAQVADLLRRYRPDVAEPDLTALARLSEGSIGRALALAGEGGLDLYREVVGLLQPLPRLDVGALHAFADRLGRAGGDEAWRTLGELLPWWLARLVRAAGVGGAVAEVVPGEAALAQRLMAARGLDQWVEVWEKITTLFTRADAVNLDRKQVVLNAFLTVEQTVR